MQGVGFRPAVARCAADLRLDGSVANAVDGVLVELEGDSAALDAFLDCLRAALPARAEIASIESEALAAMGRRGFTLGESIVRDDGPLRTRVPSDVRVCESCLAEVRGASGRRGGYGFVSCVDCGPRYSILTAMPFDRQRTAMSRFTPCADCATEYGDARDRRFHAQTNACWRCGPQVHAQRIVAAAGPDELPAGTGNWLEAAIAALKAGEIVALRGVGGYQLLVDATHDAAVQRLRARKMRPEKPLALLVADLAAAHAVADCGPLEAAQLLDPAGPIVLVTCGGASRLSPHLHPGLREVGLMLPTTPLHALLADRCGPLVATSANLDGEPLIYSPRGGNEDLASGLRELADVVVTHNRAIERPVDDSVVRVIAGRPAMMRLGRGYAPLPLPMPPSSLPPSSMSPSSLPLSSLPLSSSPSPSSRIALPLAVSGEEARRAGEPVPAIVALGGHQKAAFASFNGDQAVLGPHIGDLDGEASRRRYLEQLRAWLALYGGPVSVVAHDAHPDYWTTRLAENWRDFDGQPAGTPPPLRLIPVQHHHAHVVAAMVEHRLLSTEVLGVAWDGTGWGPDGTIWGGEFLVANSSRYRRVARLRPFALPGGERAVRQPWRTAVSLLAQAWDDPLAAAAWMGARAVREPAAAAAPDAGAAAGAADAADAAAETTGSPPLVSLEPRTLEACARLATARPRSPLVPWTSSVGRLFDGLAAMILPDARRPMSYEGQAAAWLEAVAQGETAVGQDYQDYALEWEESVDSPPLWELDWRPLVRAVARDVERGQPAAALAAAFHRALADAIEWVADRHADLPVVLGGGVFQNRLLVEMTAARFASRGRWLGTPGMIPVNDGGLAAGQLAVAMAVAAT